MSEIKFTKGDPERDFFEQNPHWRYLDSSVKLFEVITGKELCSKIRWATFLVLDPDSPYHRHPMVKRVETVNKNYLKGDYTLEYNEERRKLVNEDLAFLFDMYGAEVMSKPKRDYYERELSYQMLVQQERASGDLKLKADVQVKLGKIYEELKKAKEAFEKANSDQRKKSRGTQQPGILFGE